MAYANTGFNTFYQNNIPVHIMGRIGSIYGLFIAGITILITILFGVATQFISIQLVVIVGSFSNAAYNYHIVCIYFIAITV